MWSNCGTSMNQHGRIRCNPCWRSDALSDDCVSSMGKNMSSRKQKHSARQPPIICEREQCFFTNMSREMSVAKSSYLGDMIVR
mmetsp:Transcript_1166/g.2443  ORF Transcript_1166/g.2443 Transcript_1166/m.2443 type:complete len:83 (-) Transcript_1166:272-520(-)